MSLGSIDTATGKRHLDIPHVQVASMVLGDRSKQEGRPLPAPTSSLDGLKKYVQRAAAIGYEPDPVHVLYEQLKIVIAENNILLYDDKAVHEWMCKMAQKQGPRMKWVWKSLTKPLEQLIGREAAWSIHYQYKAYELKIDGYYGEVDRTSRYTKIIPEAVLATAETILKHFKKTDPICLLVSDYAVVQPDPFLAVAVPQFPFLIVDFWDEPGFQPKAAETNTQKGLNK